MNSLETSNIVSSGKLDLELDLEAVSEDLGDCEGIESVEHSRKQGNRILISFKENDTTGIVISTGTYIFTGAKEVDEIRTAQNILFTGFSDLGILSSLTPSDTEVVQPLEVKNMVFTGDLEEEIDLDTLFLQLGFENAEYDPEQFSGLIYKPPNESCTMLIFSTGKVVVMGSKHREIAEESFSRLEQELLD